MNVRKQRDLQGLTLTEMAVVLAACAALAAALLPLAFRARGEARRMVCSDNLSRLGIAFNKMLPDRNGYFTDCYYNVTALREGVWWVGLKNPWDPPDPLTEPSLAASHACPASTGRTLLSARNAEGASFMFATTYAHNIELPIIGGSLSRVPEPQSRVLLYDGDAAAVVGPWRHTQDWAAQTVRPRHGGMANVLFLDGHVEAARALHGESFHACPMGQLAKGAQTLAAAAERPGPSDRILSARASIDPQPHDNDLDCEIVLPNAFGRHRINENSVYLVGAPGRSFAVPISAAGPVSQSAGGAGALVLQCRFNRQALCAQLAAQGNFGASMPMRIVGQTLDGRPFEGLVETSLFDSPAFGHAASGHSGEAG